MSGNGDQRVFKFLEIVFLVITPFGLAVLLALGIVLERVGKLDAALRLIRLPSSLPRRPASRSRH